MKVTKRDFLTIAAFAVVLIVLIMSTIHEKAKRVPVDEKHRAFYEAIQEGRNRIEAERGCITCHNPHAIPLPKKTPAQGTMPDLPQTKLRQEVIMEGLGPRMCYRDGLVKRKSDRKATTFDTQ
jgi:hypothetical protein